MPKILVFSFLNSSLLKTYKPTPTVKQKRGEYMAKKVIVAEETWTQLRLEYISTDTSMRKLEKKYGVPLSQIRTRLQNENWQELRQSVTDKTTHKSIDLISDMNAEKCTRAFRVADTVMDKLEQVVENIDPDDPEALRMLKEASYTLKHVKEIGYFRSGLDQAEQEARIKKLQKDAEEEEMDTTITVKFMEDAYGD